MQKSIAAIVGAALAVLMVTASVAAADPFGWRASGQNTNGGYGNGGYDANTNWTPAATAVPVAIQPAATQPAATPLATARPSATATPTRHHAEVRTSPSTRMTQPQATQYQDRHGSDWCDDYGRDDHGSDWH